jgi:5-methylcytosine-specific restriction enzyme subunit McrC
MIAVATGIKLRPFTDAELSSASTPVSDLLLLMFLKAVEALGREGLFHSYSPAIEASAVYRGRILFSEQAKQLPGRRPTFVKEVDEWLPDNPENRVVKAALRTIIRISSVFAGSAKRMLELFQAVSDVSSPLDELSRWQVTRSRAYVHVKPLAEMVLRLKGPGPSIGRTLQTALLFPMPYLFERYVTIKLRQERGWTISRQVQDRSLATMAGRSYFALRPDIIARKEAKRVILDAKWKMPALSGAEGVKRVAPQDVYQALAYSEAYRTHSSQPSVVLVYPRTERLLEHRGPFEFPSSSILMLVPFDLLSDGLTISLDEIALRTSPSSVPRPSAA